jgi:Pregnancy-associated plasma protein-A/Secretion system C-terminal sorting domain
MKIKLLFILFIANFALAQQRTCGMEAKMQRIMADPIAKQEYLNFQARFEIELAKLHNNANRAAAPAATIYVPVAVHFPDVTTPSTCLRALAQSQINVLNADYNATNADLSTWTNTVKPTHFPTINHGVMNVQFVLATQNHPAGTGLVNGDLAVTFGTNFLAGADNDSNWAGYFNLVCRNAGSGILGYSPLGGSLASGATVVIAEAAFGSGAGCAGTTYIPSAPYHLGRTLTHELGHFFNLNHTFQACTTTTNCATAGDKVCDTPASNAAVYGCPTPGATLKCSSTKTLTMNFMDYTDDACMYMFTAGQATRMTAWYNTVASTIKTNVLANNEFLANNFSILPNPSNGSFVLNLKEVLDNYSVEIFDGTGRTIYEKTYSKNQDLHQTILLNQPQAGVYFLNIKSDSSLITKKIIIE